MNIDEIDMTTAESVSSMTESDAFAEGVTFFAYNIVPVIFSTIIAIGFIGNSLVIIVIVLNKKMRSTTNYLILNLAAIDLMYVATNMPLVVIFVYDNNSWRFGNVMCKLWSFQNDISLVASAYTLVMMSIERYMAVVHPFSTIRFRTEKNIIRAISYLWVFAIVSCIHSLFIHHEVTDTLIDGGTIYYYQTCTFVKGINKTANSLWDFFFTFAFPIFVMLALYSLMLHKLWFDMGNIRGQRNEAGLVSVTKTVITVVIVFIICLAPSKILVFLEVNLLVIE